MNINDMDRIKKVEVPPFLFTRIKQKIEDLNSNYISKRAALILGASFVIIVGLNIGLIIGTQSKSQSINHYAQSLNITTTNNFYND